MRDRKQISILVSLVSNSW